MRIVNMTLSWILPARSFQGEILSRVDLDWEPAIGRSSSIRCDCCVL